MCPRRLDRNNRAALIDIAAGLISREGPTALSARRLATEAGTSTMAVYTYFGGMGGLVREIVREGFARLARLFDLVEPTGDSVADLALLGRAYRHHATTSPHLHKVMFGGYALAGFVLAEEDRQLGRYTLGRLITCTALCITSGRFRQDDPVLVAHGMWLAVHGTVTLELGAYLVGPYDGDRCFEAQLAALMVGAGDRRDRAVASVAESRRRFAGLVMTS
jgi:AcrR family transcriptional regulator